MRSPIATAAVILTLVVAEPAHADGYPSSWSGFYVGAHGGYGEVYGEFDGFDIAGGVLGGHAGYNYQMGSVVLSLEGDIMATNIEDTVSEGGASATAEVDSVATIRSRLGYSLGDVLLYGTAGYAWTETTFTIKDPVDPERRRGSSDGPVVGLGLDYKFAANWSGRLEGLTYWFSDDIEISDPDLGVMRAGISWHLYQ